MTDDDSIRFKNGMASLGIAFSKAIGSPLITVYWKGLRGVGIDLFETAVERLISEDRQFPKVARILEIVNEIQGKRAKQNQLTAGDEHHQGKFFCEDCRDSGMKPGVCTPDHLCKWCKAGQPEPARWMVDCQCKTPGTNPNFDAYIQARKANAYKPDRKSYGYHD